MDMEKMFGEWYRIVDLEPRDEILKMRWEAIETFVDEAEGDDILDLAGLFHQHAAVTPGFVDRFREAFFALDKAFMMRGNDAEIAMLAGAALLELAKVDDEATAACAGLAVICPSFQRKRRGEIVPDIGDQARERMSRQSADLRAADGEFSNTLSYRQIQKEIEKISAACAKNVASELGAPLGASLTNLDAGISSGVDAIRRLYRRVLLLEEASDIFWWMNSVFSRDLEKPLSLLAFPAVCVLVGKELADLVKVFPGPHAAKAVLYTVLQKTKSRQKKNLKLADAVGALEDGWKQKWSASAGKPGATPLCPLLFTAGWSLRQDQAGNKTQLPNLISGLDPKVEVSPVDLAYQAYQESLFARAFKGASGEE